MRRNQTGSPRPLAAARLVLPCVAMMLAILSCGEETTSVRDVAPPAGVTNLNVSSVTDSSVSLNWTAPGDDGGDGTATEYDLRHSETGITEESWPSATEASSEPEPGKAGTSESCAVEGLTEGTLYYFALKTSDEVPNWSGLSNVASATTSTPDTIPPARVSDLRVTAVSDSTISLAWTTPEDPMRIGGLARYDIRYSRQNMNEQSWEAAEQVDDEPLPGRPSSPEDFTLAGLEQGSIYFIALKTMDASQNWSDLSNVAQGQTRVPYVVSPDGTGAFPTIQEAIDAIPQGSVIELTDGIFTGDGNRDLDFRERSSPPVHRAETRKTASSTARGRETIRTADSSSKPGKGNSPLFRTCLSVEGMHREANSPADSAEEHCASTAPARLSRAASFRNVMPSLVEPSTFAIAVQHWRIVPSSSTRPKSEELSKPRTLRRSSPAAQSSGTKPMLQVAVSPTRARFSHYRFARSSRTPRRRGVGRSSFPQKLP